MIRSWLCTCCLWYLWQSEVQYLVYEQTRLCNANYRHRWFTLLWEWQRGQMKLEGNINISRLPPSITPNYTSDTSSTNMLLMTWTISITLLQASDIMTSDQWPVWVFTFLLAMTEVNDYHILKNMLCMRARLHKYFDFHHKHTWLFIGQKKSRPVLQSCSSS